EEAVRGCHVAGVQTCALPIWAAMSVLQHHWGTDMAAPSGTPIRSFAGGVVTQAGWLGQGGNVVIVHHGNGMATRYHHMSKIDAQVGQVVAPGQQIGRIGSTGYSTGPHLHFMVLRNGKDINPEPYLFGKQSIDGYMPGAAGEILSGFIGADGTGYQRQQMPSRAQVVQAIVKGKEMQEM